MTLNIASIQIENAGLPDEHRRPPRCWEGEESEDFTLPQPLHMFQASVELDGGDETCHAKVKPAVTEDTDHVDQRVSDGLARRHDTAPAMNSFASARKHVTISSSSCNQALSCTHVGGSGNRGVTPFSPEPAELAAANTPAATGSQAAVDNSTSPVTTRGDSIPAEVLLLVLSGLRDVGDCVRAALVCRHWLSVVTLSRAPHAGSPVLRPPPGCDHPHSKMLSYKTTCALTQVAVRFMVLRKGFEYVVEAAASLWLAACRAAVDSGGRQGQQHHHNTNHKHHQQGPMPPPPPPPPPQQQQLQLPKHQAPGLHQGPSLQAAPLSQAVVGSRSSHVTCSAGAATLHTPAELSSVVLDIAAGSAGAVGWQQPEQEQRQDEGCTGCGVGRGSDSRMGEKLQQGKGSRVTEEVGISSSPSGACEVASSGSGSVAASPPAVLGDGWRGGRGRITHVDQLWETCGRNRSALQVDERFNAVRVQQMVGKLCCSGGALWLSLYEGVAAVMASRCDQIRDHLTTEAAAATCSSTSADLAKGQGAKRRRGLSLRDPSSSSSSGDGGGGGGQPVLRGDMVYGGSSYADRFAELLRRGDTRGALALGASHRAAGGSSGLERGGGDGGGTGGEGGGGGVVQWELDEPEMREVVLMVEAVSEPPAIVAEGLLLWRRLLSSWPVYRRWLEVWVVWCGPLGARVEAERQLAGAAEVQREAPLAPPHLTNKGLLLFRSQVLLAYPLRRPLQAAALWLSARADQGEEEGSVRAAGGSSGRLGGSGFTGSRGGGSGGASAVCGSHGADGPGLSEEHGQLLTAIRKPPQLHTRQKLQRCFGSLLLRPVSGVTRALQLAQRLQGLREAAAAGGGGSGAGGGSW
ncbi:hypothetical protein VOLCADRAFT_120609 [Volvox carteri f. nagariensis]|uniref:F-box domain-containing protein n=1 Tax=Volvox carteri f. nagariensis TaxID=3068 RepID=D8TPL2_VOLCA|nr:uncharacterized protein VOLCADRAFT_120609 [Volvox carteri f. nagariensis]EFJ50636.1 hypothetical protein VOLCADRAFT_120609 [Volvox carteri f. nagariensis]|eukprot:XP_002948229.1 hypothetical protein VOLCADRAFT_120609 [Volvox carteri f. nagariensis]